MLPVRSASKGLRTVVSAFSVISKPLRASESLMFTATLSCRPTEVELEPDRVSDEVGQNEGGVVNEGSTKQTSPVSAPWALGIDAIPGAIRKAITRTMRSLKADLDANVFFLPRVNC